MTKIIKHLESLDFTIVADPSDHYFVTYTIYDIEGWDDGKPVWHKARSRKHPDHVDTIDEAQIYLHGYVKWDGCSNWFFDQQMQSMLHGCSREDVLRFGEVMALCWDWTKELCPCWLDD